MDINGLRDFRQTLVQRGIAQGSASASKIVAVMFCGTVVNCRVGRDLTVAAGDIVLVNRVGMELVVLVRLHAAAPTAPMEDLNTYPTNPWESVQTGSSSFRPVETRSYYSVTNKWRTDSDDTFQGDWGSHNQKGCAFYGNGPTSLSGAEVTSAKIKVRRDSGSSWSPYSPTTLRRFEEKTKPAHNADVTFLSGTTTGPKLSSGASADFTIPTAWGQELVDGTAGGLAIYDSDGSPKARLDGRASWSAAWTLLLTWQRVI